MRTEAQKKAEKKYRDSGKAKYATLNAVLHVDNLDKVKKAALSSNLTPSKFATRAVFYCANNNIDLSQYDEPLHAPDDSDTEKPE